LTGEKESEFKAHQDAVGSLGFSHSGRLLGSSSWDGEFRLWDLTAERPVLTALGQSYQSWFSADDRRIGYIQRGPETGSLEVTPSSIFHRLNSPSPPDRGSFSIDVSPDGRLVAATYAKGVRIWADQQTDEPFFLLAGSCYSAIFTPDGTNLITCGPSGLALRPMQRISSITSDELHIGPPQTIQDGLAFNYAALNKNGRWVAAADSDKGELSIYEVRNPTNQFSVGSQSRITLPAISPDGRWVAGGNFKTSGVKVWELESKRLVCALPTRSSAWATFSPDNRWLAVSGESFDLLETGSWRRKYSIRQTRPEGAAMTFSPDSRILAVVVERGTVRLLAAETGDLLADLDAPGAGIIAYLCFSPDGSQLYALEWGDKQVQVWDLRRIRTELRKLNLDWSTSPIPAETVNTMPVTKPLRIFAEGPPR